MASLVAGAPLIPSSAVMVPVAGALSVVILAALVKRLTNSSWVAYASALMLSLFFNNVMMCGGVIKECYACPIALALLLTPLVSKESSKPSFWFMIISLSIALSLSHHLTLLLTLMVFGGWVSLELFNHFIRGSSINVSTIYLTITLALIGYSYNSLYAWGGLKLTLSEDLITSLISYYVVFAAMALYLWVRGPKASRALLSAAALAALVAPPALTYLASAGGLHPFLTDSTNIPPSFTIYSISYSVLGALAILGYGISEGRKSIGYLILWLSSILSFEVYALIAEPPMAVDLTYRALDFLAIPLIVLASLPLKKPGLRKAASAGIAVFLAINSLMIYSTITGVETHLGHFWMYGFRDLELASLINSSIKNRFVYGDVRTALLYGGLYRIRVDPSGALSALESGNFSGTLIIYGGLLRDGFVGNSGSLIRLSPSVINGLVRGDDFIYLDGWGAVVWRK